MPAAGAAVPAVAEGAGQLEDLDEPPEPRVRGGSGRAGLMKPLVVLALPGMYLFYKYSQYRREQRELSRRRVTERELQHLHHKIKLFGTHDMVLQTSSQGRSLQRLGLDNLLGQCWNLAKQSRQDGACKKCPRARETCQEAAYTVDGSLLEYLEYLVQPP
ncbi:Uncharacterized protein DBV15_08272 [Temnothorax longispinosus]|uniref:Uncharacterized protein n=1 Tax=Temnothorax longispinosus TaxID=300112 RepID=A0A4S2KH38_9HYME|nr:Uncharacterized protein DBV15_08272 [Temnothorax longispinosus]